MSGFSRTAELLQEHDQEHEDFGQNRDAFEQEQRQVDGARNLRSRGWLARNPFGGGCCEPAEGLGGILVFQGMPKGHSR